MYKMVRVETQVNGMSNNNDGDCLTSGGFKKPQTMDKNRLELLVCVLRRLVGEGSGAEHLYIFYLKIHIF